MTNDFTGTPGLMVGGFPEPDGGQPMSPAEFRMVSEAVGLTQADLSEWLAVHDRSIRRWTVGDHPVPDGVREALEGREAALAETAEQIVAALRDASDVVLTIPRDSVPPETGAFWRAVAYRVAEDVPGLHVRYADSE